MATSSENVGIALALVIGAGASTGIGAAVVFFPGLVVLASKRVLACSLGFAAGIMIYVSFIEIFTKSLFAFVDAGVDKNKATIYATLCFFAGVLLMMVCVLWWSKSKVMQAIQKANFAYYALFFQVLNKLISVLMGKSDTRGSSSNHAVCHHKDSSTMGHTKGSYSNDEEEMEDMENQPESGGNNRDDAEKDADDNGEGEMDKDEKQQLNRMGINTALAIALHNFPEGLATFVAAISDPTVGVVLAIAIVLHNIPEGLCVAMPIYYASGSRLKAFSWALLSGFSEVIAALLGWAVLATAVDDVTYAILFGIVSGMMVIISVRELLPTAHHYDPTDTLVSYSFILGMALMALSLVLFLI